jgi:two-component system, sensor histidine kinase and response regulator
MNDKQIQVLLIEDNPGDARLVSEALALSDSEKFAVECVDCLKQAVERLQRGRFNVVLLDLSLPDAEGFDSIVRLTSDVPRVPLIVLSGNRDPELIHDAVKKGAEDYLVKGAFSTDSLVRSVRYAIDRHHSREQLSLARDSALEGARLRAEFLANMSHEIRTPLNGIIGMTRLLSETPLNTDQREMVEIARDSADALLRIVNEVLDFSKISAGKVTLDETDFNLGTELESVVALFSEQAHRKGIELASYVDADVPVLLRGDPVRLCQVLTNLIGNAVKFTRRGYITIRVGLIDDLTDQAVLRFTIRDTGIGIPIEGQRYLFQAFAQAHGSIMRKYGGTGLGLAISAQLVELMGGNIGVQSEPEGGSTFWFTASFRRQPQTVGAHMHSRSFEGTRILVTDPNVVSAYALGEQLRAWGMQCDVAASGAEAIAILKKATADGTPYEIVILDLKLPDMPAMNLGRMIKTDPGLSGTDVLAIYALGERPDESQMRAAGIRGLLTKPIKQSQLFNNLSMSATLTGRTPTRLSDGTIGRRKNLSEIRSILPAEVRRRTRILLVEDDVLNQQVQVRMLEKLGYKADVASNGREALEILSDHSYDIVLMDCQMPELDGCTTCRAIRRNEKGARPVTIIGVTAHALASDRDDCLAAGMDDYISKPIIPEELAAIVEKWIIARNDPIPDYLR